MAKKKLNPSFSSSIQMLLDGVSLGYGEMTVNDLLALLQKDKLKCNEYDKLYDSHQYPDKALKYSQYRNFNECRADMELSASALKILLLFIKDMPENSLVSVSKEYIQKITHLSKPTIIKSIQELLDNGFIALMLPPTNKQAPIYMVNPDVANTGKPVSDMQRDNFKDLVMKYDEKGTPLLRFIDMNRVTDNIAIEHCKYVNPLDGKMIKYNSYREVADKEKGSSVRPTDKPQKDDTPF